jgi:hypothetical protein
LSEDIEETREVVVAGDVLDGGEAQQAIQGGVAVQLGEAGSEAVVA